MFHTLYARVCCVFFLCHVENINEKNLKRRKQTERERAGREWSVSELHRHRRGSVCAQYVRE